MYGKAEGKAELVNTPYIRWFNDTGAGIYYQSYYLQGASPSTSKEAGGFITTYEFNVNINKECKNVMAALEKHGIILEKNAFNAFEEASE